MPIYAYNCSDCGQTFDELVRKPDDEPSECKYCKSAAIARAVSAHGGVKGDFGTVYKANAGSYRSKK
jgi:putative FmdB family regulatory protein